MNPSPERPPTEKEKGPINPKGIYCPDCRGVRLFVLYVKRPCPGRCVRYLICSTCDTRIKSTEKVDSGYTPRKKPYVKVTGRNKPHPKQRIVKEKKP